MNEVTVSADELTDEQVRSFRRAAAARGVDQVVEWQGHPHVVTHVEGTDDAVRFTLEPVPRPFG